MKSIFLYIIVVAVVALIFLVFIIRGRARRQGQKGRNNILNLKPGKANYESELAIPFSDGTLLKIKELLAQNNFRIIDDVQDGIIAYSGKNEDATLGGWLNVSPFKLPFRIVVTQSGTHIKVSFADDYGFQVLNKSQLQKFNEVYRPVFTHYEDLIKKQF
jgi:hypothetical protein